MAKSLVKCCAFVVACILCTMIVTLITAVANSGETPASTIECSASSCPVSTNTCYEYKCYVSEVGNECILLRRPNASEPCIDYGALPSECAWIFAHSSAQFTVEDCSTSQNGHVWQYSSSQWTTNTQPTYADNTCTRLVSPPFSVAPSSQSRVTLVANRFSTAEIEDNLSLHARLAISPTPSPSVQRFVPVNPQPASVFAWNNSLNGVLHAPPAQFVFNSSLALSTFSVGDAVRLVVEFVSDFNGVSAGIEIAALSMCGATLPTPVPNSQPTQAPPTPVPSSPPTQAPPTPVPNSQPTQAPPTPVPNSQPTQGPPPTPMPSSQPAPTPPPCVVTAQKLSASISHACLIGSSGKLMCWGYNAAGQTGNWPSENNLGDDEAVSEANPVQLPPGRTATQVCTGVNHTCVLLSDSSVACWGSNLFGQLGNPNTSVNINPFVDGPPPRVNVSSDPSLSVTQVACGGWHTCALLSTGDISCWGRNDLGQLGRNGNSEISTPALFAPTHVTSIALIRVIELELALYHSCALLSDRSVTCWGNNGNGQLGRFNTDSVNNASSVSAIPILGGPLYYALQISAGNYHVCALLENHSVHCWGSSGFGQLGYSSQQSVADNSTNIFRGSVQLTTQPSSIYAVQVSAGDLHTCVRFNDGSIKCWGRNDLGQLGIDPTVTNAIGYDPTTAVANYGQINIGTARQSAGAVSIEAGLRSTCAFFNNPNLDVVCWGLGDYGIIGNGLQASAFDVSSLPPIYFGSFLVC